MRIIEKPIPNKKYFWIHNGEKWICLEPLEEELTNGGKSKV